mgnify:CR=1 FL=1
MGKKGVIRSKLLNEKNMWYDDGLDEGFEKLKKDYFKSATDANIDPEVITDEDNKYEFITNLGEKFTLIKEEKEID